MLSRIGPELDLILHVHSALRSALWSVGSGSSVTPIFRHVHDLHALRHGYRLAEAGNAIKDQLQGTVYFLNINTLYKSQTTMFLLAFSRDSPILGFSLHMHGLHTLRYGCSVAALW